MRKYVVLMTATALSACSGGEVQAPGSVAAGSGSTTTGTGSTTTASTFVTPTQTKTYQSQAAVQAYSYGYTEALHYDKTPIVDAMGNFVLDALGNKTYKLDPNSRKLVGAGQAGQLYTANASTVRSPGVTVSYDPRNAQFTLQISQNSLSDNITFQDPAHRTDFSGATTPQSGVPNLEVGDPSQWRTKGVQYLEVSSGSTSTVYDVSTFFYELPGTSTKYVTYAGFVRNHFDAPVETITSDTLTAQTTNVVRKTSFERATFVYGEQTSSTSVPTTGSATYTGSMIASMIDNPAFDVNPGQGSYFQWLSGTANVSVNFGSGVVNTTLAGTTLAPLYDRSPILAPTNTTGFVYDGVAVPAGAAFSATSAANINLVNTGGFTGTFSSAKFVAGGVTTNIDIVGSTLDGAFYGPKGDEVGATFRIVGGIPDQRVDIVGAFTGKQP